MAKKKFLEYLVNKLTYLLNVKEMLGGKMKTNIKVLIIFVGVIIVGIVYGINQFYFNPVTFNDLGLKNNQWYKYNKTLEVDLEYWNKEDTEIYLIKEADKIRFMYNEIKKSEVVTKEEYCKKPRYVWFNIRKENEGVILLHLDVA